MDFNNKLPEWKNTGTEPSESLKTSGWKGGDRPPAEVFNWFWSKVIKAITEIQTNLSDFSVDDINGTVPVAKGGTGAKNVTDAVTNLLRRATVNSTNQVDANTVTETCVRMVYIDDSSIDPTTLNYPNRYGVFFAQNAVSYCSQMFFDVASGTFHYRSSTNSGNTWSNWRKIYDSTNKPTPEDIGAAKNDLSNVTGAKIKTYTALSQIGLSIGGETIGGLFNSLPTGSMIMYYPTYQYRKDMYPDYGETNRVGMFIAYKPTSTYMYVMFTRSGNSSNYVQQWVGNYSSTNSFSGWKEVSIANDGTVTSANADYAEVGEWADGNTSDEDRIGYFVAIDDATSGTTMVKANASSDVRGVTVSRPAFSGNCSADKFDAEGNLLKQYDYVAVMGLVSVIDNGTCTINERCMPADDGTAIPSTNNMGYQVIERIDDTHVLIGVEPSADMLNRIKTAVTGLESGKANKPTTATYTMLSTGWNGGVYSFEDTYPIATYDISIELDGDNATDEQIKAWSKAKMVGSATANKCYAKGDVPTVNIPVILKAVVK